MAAAALADGVSITSDAAAVAMGNEVSRICRREICIVVVMDDADVLRMPS